ncbi:MAG: hypothetical protein ACI8ZM_002279 [Crocinitomix sp.]
MQRKKNTQASQANESRSKMNFLDSVKSGVIQPKLSIGKANDKFEVEADQMADKVMRMPEVGETVNTAHAVMPAIQRKCDGCKAEETTTEELQAPGVQAKEMDVSSANDENIQAKHKDSLRHIVDAQNPTIQMKPSIHSVRIFRKEEEENLLQKQGNENSGRGPPIGDFSSKLNQSKGSGQPMDSATNSFMSSRFGADFSDVKIHNGSDAANMSDSINAKAFTHQNNVYFNQGQYQPNSNEGKTLLAHELTHTIQQGAVGQNIQRANASYEEKVQTKLEIGSPNDKFEQEADQMANQVMRKCATCEDEKTVQRVSMMRTDKSVQRKCASCQEEKVQRKCATCEEERIQRKCSKCGEKEELRRKPIQISRGPPVIQRYSWSEFTNDVSNAAGSAYNRAAGVANDAYDAVADAAVSAYDSAVSAGKAAYNTVRSAAETAAGMVREAADWMWNKIGDAANWAWERVTQFSGWVIGKFQQAWAYAKRIATTIAGAVTFQNGILTITGPDLSLCPPMTLPLPAFEEQAELLFPLPLLFMGDHIDFLGSVGLQLSLWSQFSAHFGPCNLHNTSMSVDILGASSTVSADLDFNAGVSMMTEVRGGAIAHGSALIELPYGGPKILVAGLTLEAGGAGNIDGSIMSSHQMSFSASRGLFSGTTLNMSDNAIFGIEGGVGFSAYAGLSLLGVNLCSLYYPLWEKRFQAAANIDFDIGLTFGGMMPSVAPSFNLNNISGVPYSQVPEAYDGSILDPDCPLCDVFQLLGLMPTQQGVQWSGHPEPAWGGPLFAYPKAPQSIASGAKCRGACGPDCHEDACTAPVDKYECEETENGHTWHLYPQYTKCDTHPGCQQHDHCYDWCAEGGEFGIVGPCHRWCDFECACDYGMPSCVDWARGGGVSSEKMPFSDPPSSTPGCRGGCPKNMAAKGEEPQYELCLPDFRLMERQEYSDGWSHTTPKVHVHAVELVLPYVGPVVLELKTDAEINTNITAGVGPIMLKKVCLGVDPSTGVYKGTARLNAIVDLEGIVELVGNIYGSANWLCLLKVAELIGSLIATGTAGLVNELDYKADIECVNGEIRLVHGIDLSSCLDLAFDLDAAFKLKIFGFTAYTNQWNLAHWDWEKCWDNRFELPAFGENESPNADLISDEFTGGDLIKDLFKADNPNNQTTNDQIVRITETQVEATGKPNPCKIIDKEICKEKENPVKADTANELAEIKDKLNDPKRSSTTITIPGQSGGSETVGTLMKVDYLTHEISKGSDKIKNRQKKIYGFGRLPQQGAVKAKKIPGKRTPGRGQIQYIKGHLLNHHIGGPANESNLFPITAYANGQHRAKVENIVKRHVNYDKDLMYYKVRVTGRGSPTRIAVPGDESCVYYFLNSTFSCDYATYTLDDCDNLKRNEIKSIPIPSVFNKELFIESVKNNDCRQKPGGASNEVENAADIEPEETSETEIQRKSWDKEEEYNPYSTVSKTIQRKSAEKSAVHTNSSFETGLKQTTGNPMDAQTKSSMENDFGADFSGVKIHTGATASNLSNQIQAKAFTTGNDIYFNQGEYSPNTSSGKHLLAHELTHTIQQGASKTSAVQSKMKSKENNLTNTIQRKDAEQETIQEIRLKTVEVDGRYGGNVIIITSKKKYNGFLTLISCADTGGPYKMKHEKGKDKDKAMPGSGLDDECFDFEFVGIRIPKWKTLKSTPYDLYIEGTYVEENAIKNSPKEAVEIAKQATSSAPNISEKARKDLEKGFGKAGITGDSKGDGTTGIKPSKTQSDQMTNSATASIKLDKSAVELNEEMAKAYDRLKAEFPEKAKDLEPIDISKLSMLNSSFMLEGLLMGAGTQSNAILKEARALIHNMHSIRDIIVDEIKDILIELAAAVAVSAVLAFFTLGVSIAAGAIRGAFLIRRIVKLKALIDKVAKAYRAYEEIETAMATIKGLSQSFDSFRKQYQELKGKYDELMEKIDNSTDVSEEDQYLLERAEYELVSAIQLELAPGGKLESILEYMMIPADADLKKTLLNIPAGVKAMGALMKLYDPNRKPNMKYAISLMEKGFVVGKLLFPFVGFITRSVNEKIEIIKQDKSFLEEFTNVFQGLASGKKKKGDKKTRKKAAKKEFDKVKSKKPPKPESVKKKEAEKKKVKDATDKGKEVPKKVETAKEKKAREKKEKETEKSKAGDDLWTKLKAELSTVFDEPRLKEAVTVQKLNKGATLNTVRKPIYKPVVKKSKPIEIDDFQSNMKKIRFRVKRKGMASQKFTRTRQNMYHFASIRPELKKNYFDPKKLRKVIIENGEVKLTTAREIIESWKKKPHNGHKLLRVTRSSLKDVNQQYSFVEPSKPRVLDKKSRREMFGFNNTITRGSAKWKTIMKKGFTDAAWKERYRNSAFKAYEIEKKRTIKKSEFDSDGALMTKYGMFENARLVRGFPSKTKLKYPFFDSSKIHLGHDDELYGGASKYWNDTGNGHLRSANIDWNKDAANYWGPEHEKDSSASGGKADRYNLPTTDSNEMWWNASKSLWYGYHQPLYTFSLLEP